MKKKIFGVIAAVAVIAIGGIAYITTTNHSISLKSVKKIFSSDAHASETTDYIVISPRANIRVKPDRNSAKLGEYNHNEKVKVVSVDKEWTKITFKDKHGDDQEGYISSNYLLKADSNPYKNLDFTLNDHLTKQLQRSSEGGNRIYQNGGFAAADASNLPAFLNPDDVLLTKTGLYQFARLDKYTDGVNADDINKVLNKFGKTNILYNQGQTFIDAAKSYNIDVVYLIAHSLWETQNGTSTLAKGQQIFDKSGKSVVVYNFFGIGATDGSANAAGAQVALVTGWTSASDTIKGSAKWIADNYIHNSQYQQKTLYEMRWYYPVPWHQYATDINWAAGVANNMGSLSSLYKKLPYTYEIPVYKAK